MYFAELLKFTKGYKKTIIAFFFVLLIMGSFVVFVVPLERNNLLVHSVAAAGETPPPKTETSVGGTDTNTNTPEDPESYSLASTFVGTIIGGIAKVLVAFISYIVVVLTDYLIRIAQYNSFITAKVVVTGWNLVRDIANMFFVLMLLMISFGTILGLEQYQLKKLLPKVILMAVLVNFSKAISGLLIDFSQVILLTFASAYQTMGSGNLMTILGMDKITTITTDDSKNNILAGWNLTAAYLLGLAYAIAALIAIGAFVLIFTVRIVMLWILIILSPMAYVLSIVPIGQKYASQWWGDFSKYVIVGPVIAFFLWLSLATLGPTISSIESLKTDETTKIQVGATLAGSNEHIFALIIGIAMLMASLMMAQEIGGVAGKIAGSAMSKLQSGGIKAAMLPFKAAKNLTSWGERKMYVKTGGRTGFLNPYRVARVWRGYSERKKHHEEALGQYLAATGAAEAFKGGHGISGMLRQAAGAQEDFLENYAGPIKFFKETGKAVFQGKRYSQEYAQRAEDAAAKKAVLLARTGFGSKRDDEEIIKYGRKVATNKARKKEVDAEEARLTPLLERALPAYSAYESRMAEIQKEYEGRTTTKADLDDKQLKEKAAKTTFDTNLSIFADGDAKVARELRSLFEEAEEVTSTTETRSENRTLAQLMRAAGVPIDAATTSGAGPRIKAFQDKFIKDYVRGKAETSVDKNLPLQQAIEAEVARLSNAQLLALGKTALKKDAAEQDSKAKMLLNGGYNEDDKRTQNGVVENLLRKLVNIETAIAEERAKPIFNPFKIRDLINLRNKTITEHSVAEAEKTRMETGVPATNKEKEANIEANKKKAYKMQKEAAKLAYMGGDADDDAKNQKELAAFNKENKYKEARTAPPSYYATRAYRILENEEIGKLPHEAMEWEELSSLLKPAIEDKDIVKITSIMKKAAADYNDNEIWNEAGFESGSEGMEKYRKKVLVGEVGMTDQASMALMSDIAYINESHGHANASRSYGVSGGAYYKRTHEQQAAAAANEALKRDSRKYLQEKNRLAYGFEDGEGKYHLDLTGKLTIAGFQDDFAYRLARAEVNPSFVAKLFEDLDSIKEMERKGVLTARLPNGETIPQALERMARAKQKRGIEPGVSGLAAKARYL